MRLFLLALISIILLLRCDAPRLNPFDPRANNYEGEIPYLTDTKFYSTFENFNSRTSISFRTKINDGHNLSDITSVAVMLDESNFSQDLNMVMNNSITHYELELRLNEIDSLLRPENIVEKDFSVKITTASGDTFLYSPFNIRRVIMENLILDKPSIDNVESGEILFKWQSVELNYDFSYKIEIFSLQRLELIGEINDIPQDSSQYLLQNSQILNNLDAEDNIWSLYIIDSIGNRNKSHFNLFNYSR